MMTHEWYSSYDSLVPKVCPDYDKGLDAIVGNMPWNAERILELGCGSGNLTSLLAQQFPQYQIVAIDKDKLMLDVASTKLKNYQNVELILKDIRDVNIQGLDIITSSLVFHLLSKQDRRNILELICKSDARYLLVFDRVKGETQNQENSFLHYFVQNLQNKGLPTTTLQQLIQESRANSPMKLSEIRNGFAMHGFVMDIMYQNPEHEFVAYMLRR